MYKKITTILLLTLAIIAGVFSCQVALAQPLRPWDVIATVRFGGDSYYYCMSSCAEGKVNASTYKSSKIKWQLYCELADKLVEKRVAADYVLPGIEDILHHFEYVNRDKIDAAFFAQNGVGHYTSATNGVRIDVDKLVRLLLASKGTHIVVQLPTITSSAVQVEQLKDITVTKSSFTTYFNKDNVNRAHNIRLAAKKLDGTVVKPNERFSFNAAVGCRSEANGYLKAKVISYGSYTDGIGGGVCQVSTTLYNALLLAGFVPRASSHSLVPSYVLPAFDAMVSDSGADLTFVNTSSSPVYISSRVGEGYISFYIFGVANSFTIQRQCEQVRTPFGTVQKNLPNESCNKLVTLQNGSDGVVATAYLHYYQGDRLIKTVKLRSVTYKRVDKIVEWQ